MLAIQYAINARFMRKKMKSSMRGMYMNVAILGTSGTAYMMVSMPKHIPTQCIYLIRQLYASFGRSSAHVWIVWFGFFLAESVAVMQVASRTPGLGLEDTHLHVRMGLLTLIIIGEGVISVTRIVNKMVAPGGWTMWSFVNTLGVSTTVVR
jgi:low temperature requirement protein LtrA